MAKTLTVLFVVGLILIAGFFYFNTYIYEEKQAGGAENYQDVEFIISGERVRLVNGVAETETAFGSAAKTTVRYFGNEAEGDLSGDLVPDKAFLITQETGGSGTFFYVVGAIKNPDGTYAGTEAVLIGDRIAPQTTEYRSFSGIPGGYLVVNYADRAPGEPMTARPSVGKSIWLKLDPDSMRFGELVQNFEGESR
jgi:hypothetical protein